MMLEAFGFSPTRAVQKLTRYLTSLLTRILRGLGLALLTLSLLL